MRKLTVDEIMAVLPHTADRIAAVTAGLSEDQLHDPLKVGDWSINDILAHLRACSDVLGECMVRILREDTPEWRRVSPRAYMATKTDYPEWQFGPAFEAFRTQRAELLDVITPLPLEAWRRKAMVKVSATDIRPRSMRFYGEWLARHEDEHMPQIEKLAKRLRAASAAA